MTIRLRLPAWCEEAHDVLRVLWLWAQGALVVLVVLAFYVLLIAAWG